LALVNCGVTLPHPLCYPSHCQGLSC
jgi:hypothetical protein